MALLEWRNTPTEGRDSTPAQRLLARRTRAAVPISLRKLVPEAQTGIWESKINQKKKIQAQNFKGRLLPALRIGQPVLVQDILANGAEAEVVGSVIHCRNRGQITSPKSSAAPTLRESAQCSGVTTCGRSHTYHQRRGSIRILKRQDGENQSVGHAEPMPLTTSSQERPPTREAVQSTTRSGRTVRQPQWFGSYVKH